MKVYPLLNQILIAPLKEQEVIESGKEDLCLYGKVIAVGPDVQSFIEPGDIVAYVQWAVRQVEIKGETFYFVPDQNGLLLGKVSLS